MLRCGSGLQGYISFIANIKENWPLCGASSDLLMPVLITHIISLLVGRFTIRWWHLQHSADDRGNQPKLKSQLYEAQLTQEK